MKEKHNPSHRIDSKNTITLDPFRSGILVLMSLHPRQERSVKCLNFPFYWFS